MFPIFLLLLAAAWLGWDYLQDRLAAHRDQERRAEGLRLRRQHLTHAPDSPAAHERLGDALREYGDLPEAIAAYEKAITLMASTGAEGAGWVAGGSLENKIRLTRLELAQEESPEQYGLTLATREQTCRTCGTLAGPKDRRCPSCDTPLPADGFLETLRRPEFRHSILGEALHAGLLFSIVLIALVLASWMPIEVRGAIAISALIVLPIKLLKKIGDV